MPRRRIGQETFEFASNNVGRSSLDELVRLIDWTEIDRCLAGIYASAKGEASWPPVALFKAMLLSVWYNLSDVKLADSLDDRASFRRFCGFAAHEATPERTAFVRFRKALTENGLDRSLSEVIVRQLDEHGIIVQTGTLVDATIIPSASIRHDGEARWVGHRRKKPVHGYKAHVATDEEGIVRRVEITPANVHDGSMLPSILPSEPGTVYADMGYDSHVNRKAIHAKGGQQRIAQRSAWGRDPEATRAALNAWNGSVAAVRCRIEKVFGTWKRSYGLARMRFFGLAKASLQVHFTAIAYNLRRAWRILAPQSA
jgi:IS5 family transposase